MKDLNQIISLVIKIVNEIASDSEIDNIDSIKAHNALGFKEVERSVCFLKKIG